MATPLIIDGRNLLDPAPCALPATLRGHRPARQRLMDAVVLVGGSGTRLRPLTLRTPKPMLTLVDRPLLAYLFDQLAAPGVDPWRSSPAATSRTRSSRISATARDGVRPRARVRRRARAARHGGGRRRAAERVDDGLPAPERRHPLRARPRRAGRPHACAGRARRPSRSCRSTIPRATAWSSPTTRRRCSAFVEKPSTGESTSDFGERRRIRARAVRARARSPPAAPSRSSGRSSRRSWARAGRAASSRGTGAMSDAQKLSRGAPRCSSTASGGRPGPRRRGPDGADRARCRGARAIVRRRGGDRARGSPCRAARMHRCRRDRRCGERGRARGRPGRRERGGRMRDPRCRDRAELRAPRRLLARRGHARRTRVEPVSDRRARLGRPRGAWRASSWRGTNDRLSAFRYYEEHLRDARCPRLLATRHPSTIPTETGP